jgi:hypothetical protein
MKMSPLAIFGCVGAVGLIGFAVYEATKSTAASGTTSGSSTNGQVTSVTPTAAGVTVHVPANTPIGVILPATSAGTQWAPTKYTSDNGGTVETAAITMGGTGTLQVQYSLLAVDPTSGAMTGNAIGAPLNATLISP